MRAPRPARLRVAAATCCRGGGLAGDVAGFRRVGAAVMSFVFGVDRDRPVGAKIFQTGSAADGRPSRRDSAEIRATARHLLPAQKPCLL